MDLIFTQTSDDLKLPGFYYPAEIKDLCVLFVHGMSGFILENYFGHVMGQEFQKNGMSYIFTHNRGYSHINDINTSQRSSDGGFQTKRNGAVYERFAGCVPDIEAWLEKARELGYKKFVIVGHSLGGPKVVRHFYKNKPKDIVGVILVSPADIVGSVKKPGGQPDYEELLQEARENVNAGNPEKLLSRKIEDWYILSSQTFLDLFEENGIADNLPVLRNPERFIELESIDVPVLCVMGENDSVVIRTLEDDMELLKQKAVNAPSFDTHLVPGANHVYGGKEVELAEQVVKWVKELKL